MRFSFVENIQPYENVWEYSLYRYDDVIQMGDMESYICNVKIIMLKPDSIYDQKGSFEKIFYAVVEDFVGYPGSKNELQSDISEFLKEEIVEFEEKDQIVVLFC